ncbi:flagellar basal-body rod protein FlgF [Thalassotalea sp. PLHSN55]|uniref:flagellar basal-body rod protein FlgF n=1 Tax=Thalassotalea sp. PLHSN55 TaxID=3435888 RepID=UPI003F8769E9
MQLLYTALSGAKQNQNAMQIRANNLANVSTTGFKADLERTVAFQLEGYGFETRQMSQSQKAGTNFEQGQLQATGRSLDVAINGAGFLTVAAPDGQPAYTRSGNLMVGAEGEVTINGNPVLTTAGPLVLPEYQHVEFGQDGTVNIIPQGGGGQVEVAQLQLVSPEIANLSKGQDGLFRLADNAIAAQDEQVQLVSGFLESSNVNAVHELVSSMAVNRQFELQIKMMKTADNLAQVGNKLVSGS